MGLFGRNRIFKAAGRPNGDQVDISETRGVRSMHLGSVTVQSSMRLSAPFDLELEYTRMVMAFALFFAQAPGDAVVIGLGGGSIPKFMHNRWTRTRTTVLEINPQVLAAARSFFFYPPDDARLSTVIDDGAAWIATRPRAADVLVVDGFDGVSHAPSLTTPLFYADCLRALKPGGVCAMNLWGSDKDFDDTVARLREVFEDRVLLLPQEKKSNVAAFCFQGYMGQPRKNDLMARAAALEPVFGFSLAGYVDRLFAANRANGDRLAV